MARQGSETGPHGVRSVLASGGAAGLVVATVLLAGCGSIVSGFTSNLSSAILDQDDVGLVRDAVPAYLLLLDSLVRSSPDDPDALGAAAQLYAVYGVALVEEPKRAQTLTARAREYGTRALCAAQRRACGLDGRSFEQFTAAVAAVRPRSADALYSYCVGMLAYIRTHSGDYGAIAALPKVEHALEHLLEIGAADRQASVNMYLGILNSLRPPMLGGQPERARAYFETADKLSGGRDLSIKVEFARGYARLVYDRELHDRLLNEVMLAEVKQPGLTLFNRLAQSQAAELLASADEYF